MYTQFDNLTALELHNLTLHLEERVATTLELLRSKSKVDDSVTLYKVGQVNIWRSDLKHLNTLLEKKRKALFCGSKI